MATTPKFAVMILRLPNDKLVLQRRTADAPYGAGLLGAFGGWVEQDETVEAAMHRELAEETSLDVEHLTIRAIGDCVIPASPDFDRDRHYYVFEATIDNANFAVYEGEGAEVYSLQELRQRSDLLVSTRYVFDHLYDNS